MRKLLQLTIVSLVIILASCKRSFQPIDYGKEACAHCKMVIMEKRFAAEAVDKKGKSYKFDDLICMKSFIADGNIPGNDLLLFVADYNNPNDFVDPNKAYLLHSEQFKSPMNGNTAAVATEDAAKKLREQTGAETVSWNSLKQ